jgi:HTH-type transcriptional regulator, glycine betaine synthesis regulator
MGKSGAARMVRSAADLLSDSMTEAGNPFIALWAQMASNWGIPRTMAEVHALLYIAGQPLNTDDVMAALGISRGSASMTLKALQEWGIVSRIHLRGDRKEYFQAEQDVWKLFRIILRERKKREIDPLLESLRDLRSSTGKTSALRAGKAAAPIHAMNERLDSMLEFIEMIDSISQRLIASGKGLELAAKLLAKAS